MLQVNWLSNSQDTSCAVEPLSCQSAAQWWIKKIPEYRAMSCRVEPGAEVMSSMWGEGSGGGLETGRG